MKKLLLLCMLIAACLITVPCVLYAQDEEDFPDDPGETDVPFDGGTSLLIIAGLAYGIKNRINEKKGKNNQEEK